MRPPVLLLAAMLPLLCLPVSRMAAVAVTQAEFDCPARQLAYAQASKLLADAGPLARGLEDVHDALQLTTACGVKFSSNVPPQYRPERSNANDRALATLHVAPTGNDAGADGSSSKPYGSLLAARDAARAQNDGPAGRLVGTIAIAAGRYELNETLTLGPDDAGVTFEGEPGTIISGGLALELQFEAVPAVGLHTLHLPPGTLQAKLPSDTGQFFALYEDGDDIDPRQGYRLPWAREPNGQVETDLQPQNLAKARGEGGTPPGPSENGSIYSIVDTPRRNNSVYPIWGRDFDPRDRRGDQVVGWQWHHVGGTSRRFGDDVGFFNGTGTWVAVIFLTLASALLLANLGMHQRIRSGHLNEVRRPEQNDRESVLPGYRWRDNWRTMPQIFSIQRRWLDIRGSQWWSRPCFS